MSKCKRENVGSGVSRITLITIKQGLREVKLGQIQSLSMLKIKLLNQSNRMTRKQAAGYLGVKSGNLACWATTGQYSLPFSRIGGLIYYNQDDLDDFLASRRVCVAQVGS